MKLLFELSMECESLARSEARAVASIMDADPCVVAEDDGILVLETCADPERLVDRLALCHHVSEFKGSCDLADIDALAEAIDVEGPIRVRATKVGLPKAGLDLQDLSRRIGGIVGKGRGVDLHSPRSELRIVSSRRLYLGRLLGSIDRPSFEKRKNRYLPFTYPISVHPKFARAMVNLTRVRDGGKVLDPFCGTGAIVTEASLAGLNAMGSDLSDDMITGAKQNLAHLGVGAEFFVCDVGHLKDVVGPVDGIATDPPYGRSTSTNGESLDSLYARSVASFGEILEKGSRVVLAKPDESMITSVDGFATVETHPLWVHRSLTRHFSILERL